MKIRPESEIPIFLQITQGLEDAILAGVYPEESQIPSITEFATTYKINPATALKGINLLVEAGIVYKKRGLGMFVATGAVEALRKKRKEQFYDTYVVAMLEEAERLQITPEELREMMERGWKE